MWGRRAAQEWGAGLSELQHRRLARCAVSADPPIAALTAPLPCRAALQEFVARVHALGVVRKRIMPFRVGDARGAGCLSAGGVGGGGHALGVQACSPLGCA